MPETNKVFYEGEDCPNCGDMLEVTTESDIDGYFFDGDPVECSANCGFEASISIADDEAWVSEGNLSELEEEEL